MLKWYKKSWIHRFLVWLDYCWSDLRDFAFDNRSVFEIIFISLYAIEQIALVFITSQGLLDASVVGYFVIIFLSTFGLHKLFIESRMKILDARIHGLTENYHSAKEYGVRLNRILNNVRKVYEKMEK